MTFIVSPRPKLKSILFILLAAFVLTACGDAGSNGSTGSTAFPTISAEQALASALLAGCTVVSQTEPQATPILPFPQVTEADWARGPEDAYVTIVEYADFQCPFCGALAPVLDVLQGQYPDEVRVIYRHFPLIGTPEQPIYDKATLSTAAAEAAGRQGKFWEMHDLLFEKQPEWAVLTPEEFEPWVMNEATTLGLNTAQFAEDYKSEELAALAQEAWEFGSEVGIPGLPYLIINSRVYDGPVDYYTLNGIIQLILLEKRQFHECPPIVIDPLKQYIATLKTEKGDIVIELLPEVAPFAVNNFVFLAQNDWYDNVSFHRVLPDFMAQTGDPTGFGIGGPGYLFQIEIDSDWTFDRAGLVAMANAGPTSNGSQFFITYGPATHLNGQFTIFGIVISGMDVVMSLTPRDPQTDPTAPTGDLILDVIIEER